MQDLFAKLKAAETAIAVVGLGYVGLPLAVHLCRKYQVIGFDISRARIAELEAGHDATGEIDSEDLMASGLILTTDAAALRRARLIIVTVPTPIQHSNLPDLSILEAATRDIGMHLQAGTVVVYESTVYPGVTEDICGPILERSSGLARGEDFFLGYSPERINPGDRQHTLDNIVKLVSGVNDQVTELLAAVYGEVVTAGVHRAPSIKTAEAAKVIENTQRDLNIALMNELATIFDLLHLNTAEVLAAAGTKWNFLKFQPGLVGGHCIGVDPYYLTYLAQSLGHQPEVILAGRRINDGMGRYVATRTIKLMIKAGIAVAGSRILVLGLTFKENVPDTRNSKVFDVVAELREYGAELLLHDPFVPARTLHAEYGETMVSLAPELKVDAIILAVQHDQYRQRVAALLRDHLVDGGVVIDIKGMANGAEVRASGKHYWCL